MLTGNTFSQNISALRMGVIETVDSNDDLMLVLERKASSSRTSKMCIENFIKPVLIMLFVRAEREADWALHLWAVKEMIPYFFAAGHVNYARYGLYYLRTMERLPTEVLTRFLKGEHVMYHKSGFWNLVRYVH